LFVCGSNPSISFPIYSEEYILKRVASLVESGAYQINDATPANHVLYWGTMQDKNNQERNQEAKIQAQRLAKKQEEIEISNRAKAARTMRVRR
jgi:regulator of protease activity HflC (stomatin/prohibitin superfamily)